MMYSIQLGWCIWLAWRHGGMAEDLDKSYVVGDGGTGLRSKVQGE